MPKALQANQKACYLRILQNGPANKEDYLAAAQLISEGYAGGSYLPDKSRTGYGGISELLWRGQTIKGALFADELAKQIHDASLGARIKLAAKVFFAWLAGIATALAPDLFKMLMGS